MISDHGGPVWPVFHIYHNTFVRNTPVFRDTYLFGFGAAGMRHTERDVFNNIFVQTDRVPGVGFVAVTEASDIREGGNLLWGYVEGPQLKQDPFAKFRASKLFEASRKFYGPGWTTGDRIVDPGFEIAPGADGSAFDGRLRADSPAVNAGLMVPREWPDPLREADAGAPDVGALPSGTAAWGVGVKGRVPLFGGK